jgi:murein L,D-transpeptidase YcbB/YkuD
MTSLRCWLAVLLLPIHTLAAAAPPFAWLDASGRSTANVHVALRLLGDASVDGLMADDYHAAELAERAEMLDGANASQSSSRAEFDGDLERALLRYLHDLHFGRIDPRSVGFRVARRHDAEIDLAALLHSAAAQGRLVQLAAELRPRLSQYGKLRDALARYRALEANGSFGRLAAAAPVEPDDPFGDALALHRRLVALGDLDADAPSSADRYDSTLVQGVRRFQQRHGLAVDGVIGRGTLAALNVPLAQRIRQLELALERLRWLPDLDAGRFIGINIPMFRLWAWDSALPADAPVSMGVVVGRALNTRTPVLSDEMRYLIVRPYWDVPRSILVNEVLPALARDPGYLQRNDMEVVRGSDGPVAFAGAQTLDQLRRGALRVRQRPGPKNSLGLLKFIFPNDENVYLHGTPATQLFGQVRRDFSHGCVRVEDPVTLAQWVLDDQPRWTRDHIEQAMAGATSLRINLSRPIPVILFYMTAMVTPADQTLRFAPDIYGHDAALVRALATARRLAS